MPPIVSTSLLPSRIPCRLIVSCEALVLSLSVRLADANRLTAVLLLAVPAVPLASVQLTLASIPVVVPLRSTIGVSV